MTVVINHYWPAMCSVCRLWLVVSLCVCVCVCVCWGGGGLLSVPATCKFMSDSDPLR